MCKILTPKEKESLAKLTKLVEGLTNKKIVLESRKDCNCCGDKKSLKENTYKSYMGNKGESVYITPQGKPNGLIPQSFKLINSSNHSMIDMTFSSPTEAKKYATKRELTIVPKPKETFSENIATVALYFGQHQLYTNVKIERAKQILKYLESIGEDLSDYFVWKSGTSEPIPANEIGWNLTNTTLPEHFNAEGLKKKLEQLNNLQESKKTLKENPFTIKRIKKYLEQELESLKPKTVTESTEGIQRIKMQYSKENISRLWDFFSIKTRKMIANSDSAWENKDININSLFAKQNERGQNAIIEYFEHHGVNKLIDINKRTMKESKQNLKEGVWALPKDAVARRKAMNFKQELQRIKTDIYNIAGSDDLYNALDNAIESLDQLITAGKSQGNI